MSSYLNPAMPGIAYGDGELQGPGDPGQIVKLTGNDLFEVVSDTGDLPAGLLGRTNRSQNAPTPSPADKTRAVVFLGTGVYETDNFTGTVSADDDLTFDASNGNLKTAVTGDKIVARALSVSDGLLKFAWTNHGVSAP